VQQDARKSATYIIITLGILGICAWISGPIGRWLVAMPLILFGPGYLLDRWLKLSDASRFAQAPSIWLALSISSHAILYAWTTAWGLRLGAGFWFALLIACACAIAWAYLRQPAPTHKHSPWLWAAFGAILLLTLITRFEQIRDLAVPPWVDSLHHAVMIQIAVEQGQAPLSLRPYAPVDNLPYHWGYHVLMATIIKLSGLDLPIAMLWTGQVLNMLMSLAGAGMATLYWRRSSAALVCALLIGVVSMMPAYYISWGRYTQLTGLLLLPAIAIMWHGGLYRPKLGYYVAAAILLAGLSIVHFRMLVFALCLVAAITLIWLWYQSNLAHWRRIVALALTGLSSMALAGPWLLLLWRRTLQPALGNPENLVAGGSYNRVNDGLLWAGNGKLLIALALLAALWCLQRHKRAIIEILLWVVALIISANPTLLGLPYSWLITNDVLVITFFLPIALAISGAVSLIIADTANRVPLASFRRGYYVILAGLALIITLWGAWDLRSVINPVTVLASSADIRAVQWASQNTPKDARFLINATRWLSIQRAVDGGWWLWLYGQRWNSVPPAIHTYADPADIADITELNKFMMSFTPEQLPELRQMIQRFAITHIFLGTNQGALRYEHLADQPGFELLYQADGVFILAVEQ
jgi:hypothetical protein